MPVRTTQPGTTGARSDSAAMTSMLRGGLSVTAAAIPVCALATFVVRGASGAYAAAVGGIIALVIFAVGYLLMRYVLEKLPASMSMAGALAVYLLQMSWMFPAMLWATALPGVQRTPLAVGAIGGTLAWMVGQVWAFGHARMPIFDVSLPEAAR